MKTLRLLFVLLGLLAIQYASAQQSNHLTLSDNFPAAGEQINIAYDTAGTVLAGKKNLVATVFFMDNKDYPASDIDLTSSGKLLKGTFSLPGNAKTFYIKIADDNNKIDDNNGSGYIYLVYNNDKKPVPGAYYAEAYLLSSGMGTALAGIKKLSNDDGIAIYRKEFELYPASEKDYSANYYLALTRSSAPADLAIINGKIDGLEKSGTEKDLQQAALLLIYTKRKPQSDSLNAIIKIKYPYGTNVLTGYERAILSEKDLTKKDSLYTVMQAIVKNSTAEEAYKNSIQDYIAVQLASAYLAKGDTVNFEKYADIVKHKQNLDGAINDAVYEMAKKGDDLPLAEKLSKQTLDDMMAGINDPQPASYQSLKQVKASNQATYDLYADTYALILFKEGKPAEALKYQQGVYDRNKTHDTEENEHYILILNSLGKYADAKTAAEITIKAGKGSDLIKDELKKDYVKIKGNDKGYETYLAALENDALFKARAELAKQMINKPAPVFTLKDIDGNTVSLSSLKGKVVIVDFWATWCGPCKASFPGMQLAVNKYKDNPNVKFVFVDCWETDANYVEGVKKFIADNKYTFHVLVDEKGTDGKQSKVVSSYEVTGIPTKFIIDKNGNIRFKYVGYSGTPESLVDEVSNMIDMTANPDSVVAGPKVSMNN